MEDSRDYFDNVASQWDNMRVNFFSESLREKAMNLAGIAVGRIACDVGVGSGFMTEGLLKNGVKVIAIDYSEKMIEEIKKKFSYSPYIDCRVGDAENLPVEDESVDYVFSNMCLHHVKNPPEAIKEMARILKIGGKVVISDLDLHNFEFLRTEQHDLWLGFDREDIRAWFINTGFNAVKVECADENCCSKSLSGAEDAKISIFIAHGIK